MDSSSLIQLELQDKHFCSYCFHILSLKHVLDNKMDESAPLICIAYLPHTGHLSCSDQSTLGKIGHNSCSDPLL